MDAAEPWDQVELWELQKATCVELGRARRELAFQEQQVLRVRYETFQHLNDGTRNITTIREEMGFAVSGFEIEAIALRCEIDQLNLTLHWVDARIAHLPLIEYEDEP